MAEWLAPSRQGMSDKVCEMRYVTLGLSLHN